MPILDAFKRRCERDGRRVILIPDSVTQQGPEALLSGSETGAIAVKGFFHKPDRRKPPDGSLSTLRTADIESGIAFEWRFQTAAGYLDREPTNDWRLVDGNKTYAIAKVTPIHERQAIVAYNLLLKLI